MEPILKNILKEKEAKAPEKPVKKPEDISPEDAQANQVYRDFKNLVNKDGLLVANILLEHLKTGCTFGYNLLTTDRLIEILEVVKTERLVKLTHLKAQRR